MKSRFRTACPKCWNWVQRGDKIRRGKGGWGHSNCQKAIDKAEAKAGDDFIASVEGAVAAKGRRKYQPGEWMAELAVKADAYSESPERGPAAVLEYQEAVASIREAEAGILAQFGFSG